VVRDGELVGIVSRADLLRAFALQPVAEITTRAVDRELRERLTVEFEQTGLKWHPYVNIVVSDGVVHLWGIVRADQEVEALRLAAERAPGVVRVESHLAVRPSLQSLS
jgi:osmotically-inducible protein OsmY